MSTEIRSYLQQLRLSANLTQQQLAERMGWTNHTIVSAVERGNRNITYDEADRWMTACGQKTAVLSSQEQEILTILRQLTPKQQADVANILGIARDGTTLSWENIETIVEFWRKRLNL